MDDLTKFAIAAIVRLVLALLRWLTRRPDVKTAKTVYMTLPQAAIRIGCRENRLRRLFERDLVPPAEVIGSRRVIPQERLPELKEAARKAGYLEE